MTDIFVQLNLTFRIVDLLAYLEIDNIVLYFRYIEHCNDFTD